MQENAHNKLQENKIKMEANLKENLERYREGLKKANEKR